VLLEHRGVVNFIDSTRDLFDLTPADRVLGFASVTFDVSVFEIFTALFTGGTVELVPDLVALQGRGPWTGTVLSAVPSVLAELVDRLAGHVTPATVVCAGEALRPELARRLRAAWPGARLVNAYGQTESFYATVYVVPEDFDLEAVTTVPVGRPLTGMRAYVLDDQLAPVPVGAIGEVYVAGVLGCGYHRRPDLTAERFLRDPFGSPGALMYRTGDLARWTADGQVEVTGRADSQLKVRGIRIEPAEVEATLSACPGVVESVVMLRPTPAGDTRLVGYVTADQSGPSVTDAVVRAFAGRRLPEFMVPAVVMVLDRLPRTSSQKIDRAALPDPVAAVPAGRAPRTADEQLLAGLFAEVLGLERIGVQDDFFAAGGYSLRVAVLASRITQAYGVRCSMTDILRHPTVEGFASAVVSRWHRDTGARG
jgi:acyl-coenzyme A synthetase/AMP-(fatty) acid ligase